MMLEQAGEGAARALVIAYLIDGNIEGPAIRAALGPSPCIVSYLEGHPPEPLSATLERAKKEAHFDELLELVLVGYSLGCSGVRDVLRSGDDKIAHLAALVVIDGTHASLPPAPWQIDVWREEWNRAKSGDILMVASHTMQLYVEHLPPSERYTATVTVLRQVTGLPLDEQGPLDSPVVHSDGKAFVYSYASSNIDKPAHIAQARHVLPELLERHVRPLLEEPATEPTPATTLPSKSRGLRALELAVAELGVHEEPPGSNDSPRIREYLAGCERNGRPLHLRAVPWCAAFASWCAWSLNGEGPPHRWRASVAEVIADAKLAGAWHPTGDGYDPVPGDLAAFTRAGGNPLHGGEGHVARVETVDGVDYTTIDGNHNDAVCRVSRKRTDPELLGFIAYP